MYTIYINTGAALHFATQRTFVLHKFMIMRRARLHCVLLFLLLLLLHLYIYAYISLAEWAVYNLYTYTAPLRNVSLASPFIPLSLSPLPFFFFSFIYYVYCIYKSMKVFVYMYISFSRNIHMPIFYI